MTELRQETPSSILFLFSIRPIKAVSFSSSSSCSFSSAFPSSTNAGHRRRGDCGAVPRGVIGDEKPGAFLFQKRKSRRRRRRRRRLFSSGGAAFPASAAEEEIAAFSAAGNDVMISVCAQRRVVTHRRRRRQRRRLATFASGESKMEGVAAGVDANAA